MPPAIRIYDTSTIEQLHWELFHEGEYARQFLYPLVKEGVNHYVDNIETKMFVLTVDNYILPLTVNDEQYLNSYVCSPFGHYVSYALDNLKLISFLPIQKVLKGFINFFGKFLKLGKINKVVTVNNWLFSTNLYPKLTHLQLKTIRAFLEKRFVDHAIMFRSINTFQTQEYFASLKKLNFDLIASRYVFFTNTSNKDIFTTRIFKSDLKLLNDYNYEVLPIEELPPEDHSKVLSLYHNLNLDKHSNLNPQLNAQYLKLVLESKMLKVKVLKKDGAIDGVVGYYDRNKVMTSPFFGYDLAKPQSAKIYRILSTVLMLEAKNHGMVLHQSSGASFFKSVRRAEGNLEYSAIYHRHLPLKRRFPWLVLKGIINTFGVGPMKKY